MPMRRVQDGQLVERIAGILSQMWSIPRRCNIETTTMPITEIADGRRIRALTRRVEGPYDDE